MIWIDCRAIETGRSSATGRSRFRLGQFQTTGTRPRIKSIVKAYPNDHIATPSNNPYTHSDSPASHASPCSQVGIVTGTGSADDMRTNQSLGNIAQFARVYVPLKDSAN